MVAAAQPVPMSLNRLEKEYATIKNKEMEEQIEIKVRPGKRWQPGATGTGLGATWPIPGAT